jgi:hypothetical protein
MEAAKVSTQRQCRSLDKKNVAVAIRCTAGKWAEVGLLLHGIYEINVLGDRSTVNHKKILSDRTSIPVESDPMLLVDHIVAA